ncbi:hypothetical protein MPL3356_110316 [Mesorhizobium plurifarium]|uniref:Uncharacterized protein n=1 Tax=Mesorhizobium plurifarium TaxID=69974 RepID=A0A090EY89_MESPL|nr:hypothetical protein MPL3356_110316 [Mesorhizobium plurifarium]
MACLHHSIWPPRAKRTHSDLESSLDELKVFIYDCCEEQSCRPTPPLAHDKLNQIGIVRIRAAAWRASHL